MALILIDDGGSEVGDEHRILYSCVALGMCLYKMKRHEWHRVVPAIGVTKQLGQRRSGPPIGKRENRVTFTHNISISVRLTEAWSGY